MRRGKFLSVAIFVVGTFLFLFQSVFAQSIIEIVVDEKRECLESLKFNDSVKIFIHEKCFGDNKADENKVINESEVQNENFTIEQKINKYDVFISEIMVNPGEGDVEWVELYNQTDENINIDGWKLIEGSQKVTGLSGQIEAKSFLVIEKGSLNNFGDYISLIDRNSDIVDEISYGDNEITIRNAEIVEKGMSYVRDFEDVSLQKLFITSEVTKNFLNSKNYYIKKQEGMEKESIKEKSRIEKVNVLEEQDRGDEVIENLQDGFIDNFKEEDSDFSVEELKVYPKIQITEVYPNPEGSDLDGEFIELYNSNDFSVNLFG